MKTIILLDNGHVQQLTIRNDQVEAIADKLGYDLVLMPNAELIAWMRKRISESYQVDIDGTVTFEQGKYEY